MNIKYLKYRYKIMIAVLCSILLIFHGRWDSAENMITTIGFYMNLSASIVLGLLVIELVHYSTVWLDERYNWFSNTIERLFLQIILALIIPLSIIILFVYLYLGSYGVNVFTSGFFLIHFPVIACFVVLLNSAYVIIYFIQLLGVVDIQEKTDLIKDSPALEIGGNSQLYLICRSGNSVTLIGEESEKKMYNCSVKSILEELNDPNLVQINRASVINIDLLAKVYRGKKRDTLEILLHSNLPFEIQDSHLENLIVTKNYIEPLKIAFKAKYGRMLSIDKK